MTPTAPPFVHAIATDPHHGGVNEWGWNGRHLYHRAIGTETWQRVGKVSPTPRRLAVLAALCAVAIPTTTEVP